ncbi:MAG: arginase [Verrucomicrobia bacterium]|nr:arginase [Verrucomicrobiota bacterium]
MSEITILENKSEIGAGTRGASLGIEALKLASTGDEKSLFAKYASTQIDHRNELLLQHNATPNAIRIEGIVEVYEKLQAKVFDLLDTHKFPVVLAADHASAGGTIAGIKKKFPEKRLGVIWIDAHADLHSPYTTPSGNVHGMPLAVSIADDNQESRINEPDETTINAWERLKQMGDQSPKLEATDIVFFGVRDTEAPEEYLMNKHRIKNFTVEECREKGMDSCANSALAQLGDCDLLYVSFDVDSMDPDIVSYGTGTPVPNGFYPEEIKELMGQLLSDKRLVCVEMVEINPLLDKKNKMAETAYQILKESVEIIQKNIVE